MYNELNEIIESLKPHNDGVKEFPLTLSIEQQKLLFSYIINLQEKNKKLKNLVYEIESIVYANISNIDVRIFIFDILDKFNNKR